MSDELLTAKGTPFRVSISCLDTFADCQRKGWYSYVERRRGPGSEATIVGSKIHDVAEKFLKGEEVDQTSRYFRCLEPGLVYAPTPEEVQSEGWGVEDWVKGTCGNLPFTGKVDIYNLEQAIVSDWKTKKDTSWSFALTPDKLAEHGQPHAYAYNLFKDDPPATVDFQHIYVTRRGKPAAMEVWAYNVPWTSIEEKWAELESQSRQVEAIARGNEVAEAVIPNTAVCRKYGGCEHAEYCAASPQNKAAKAVVQVTTQQEATMSQKSGTNSRLAALRSKLGVSKGAPAAITPKPAPVVAKATPANADQKAFADAIEQMESMLEEMPEVPARVAGMLMSSLGADLEAVAKELGLVLKDGKYSRRRGPAPKEEAPPTPAPDEGPTPGTSVKEAEAAGYSDFGTYGLKALGGILVPVSFDGEVTQAYQQYRPGTPEAEAAAAIDKIDPPEKETTKAKASAADQKAALALIDALDEAGKPLTKAKASAAVRAAVPGVQRIRAERWASILEAAGGELEWVGNKLAFTESTLNQKAEELAEKVEEVVAPEPTLDEQVEEAEAAEEIFPPDAKDDEPYAGHVDSTGAFLDEKLAELEEENARLQDALNDLELQAEKGTPASVSSRPTVYIDCLPVDGITVDFSTWVGPLEDQVATEMGLLHPGCADFAKGLNNVLGKVQAALHQKGPECLPPALYVNSQHPMASRIVPLFKRLGNAIHIVRGVK